jgi:hypothetical protein
MTATVSTDHHNNDDNHNQLTATTVGLPHHQQPPKVGSPPFTLQLTTIKQHNTPLAIKTQSTATHSQPPTTPTDMANHQKNFPHNTTTTRKPLPTTTKAGQNFYFFVHNSATDHHIDEHEAAIDLPTIAGSEK